MEESQQKSQENPKVTDDEEAEAVELILFQVAECYVYLVSRFLQKP